MASSAFCNCVLLLLPNETENKIMSAELEFLNKIKHSPLHNYGGIPGLTSWLISPSSEGKNLPVIRLMQCSRNHPENIIPHSHRYDLVCRVLEGHVANILWEENNTEGDEYEESTLILNPCGERYSVSPQRRACYSYKSSRYGEGDEYRMEAAQIHSIFFSKNTSVLFYESKEVQSTSVILEPVVQGIKIPTFKVEPWMFSSNLNELFAF